MYLFTSQLSWRFHSSKDFFNFNTDTLLLLFLNFCKEIRDFCVFSKVFDTSLTSRFKHDFESYTELTFQRMVNYTELICQSIDFSLAEMLTFNTFGIELYVTENNPKTLNALIQKWSLFGRHCQPADCHCFLRNELSTIHSKPKIYNCLKNIQLS